MDLEQLLVELAKQPLNDVLEGLKKTPIYQPIFNAGHKTATAAKTDDLTRKDAEIAALLKAKTDLQTEFDAFKAKNPSAAELQRQYTDAIAAKDRELVQLKAQHGKAQDEWRKDAVMAKIQSMLAELVDPEIVEGRTAKIRDRIQLPDETTFQIMQAGQQIPFAGDSDAQVAALVDEVYKGVPERLRRSDVVNGSGRETAAGGAGGGKKTFFENIRKSVNPEATDKNQPSNQDRLNARLGHRAS